MGTRFTPITLEDFETVLKPKGFTLASKGNEITFEFRHQKDRRYIVVIYTSISAQGAFDTPSECRDCGEDAIRITLLRENAFGERRGLVKSRKVLRTGGSEAILERTLEHSRDLYRLVGGYIKKDEERRYRKVYFPGYTCLTDEV